MEAGDDMDKDIYKDMKARGFRNCQCCDLSNLPHGSTQYASGRLLEVASRGYTMYERLEDQVRKTK